MQLHAYIPICRSSCLVKDASGAIKSPHDKPKTVSREPHVLKPLRIAHRVLAPTYIDTNVDIHASAPLHIDTHLWEYM